MIGACAADFCVAGPGAQILSNGPYGRGGAQSIGYIESEVQGGPIGGDHPVPRGHAWGTKVAEDDGLAADESATVEEMWERLTWFLARIVPVAEEAGVSLAAHPDDPPIPVLRGVGRMITHPSLYQRLLDIYDSPSNALEFCQGTISEMASAADGLAGGLAVPRGSEVPEAVRQYASQGKIAYVHFRNVVGQVPNYKEVFIDEGDIDMHVCLSIYRDAGYDGVFIPDHTPSVHVGGWHAGMAYALGYIKAAAKAVGLEVDDGPPNPHLNPRLATDARL